MRQLILIGYMGAGKTTLTQLISQQLSLPYIDIDQAIESEQGQSISTIFANFGEVTFRQLEQQKLQEVLITSIPLVATGGGIVLSTQNRVFIKKSKAFVVYLQVEPTEIMTRLATAINRPLLRLNQLALSEQLALRNPLYLDVADQVIDTNHKTIEVIISEILTYWHPQG